MAETHGRAFLGWFLHMSAHMEAPEQAQCTEHYLHLGSTSNTLFNRTPGEISLCLLFQITTEKAVLPSVPSTVGDSSKPCHSDYRHFQTFLKNVQASLVVSFPATTPVLPIQSFFSSTRPVKGHFYLLSCISFVPLHTHLPDNSL